MIGGRTRVFALLGDPVAHSCSPAMHNAAFRALGLDAVYVPLRVSTDSVEPLMLALARAGGGGNVTVPHKRVAARAAASAGGPLETCNTFWGSHGKLVGADTDAVGIRRASERLGSPDGAWLIIGTGGSARAAARAAHQAGAAVAVRSRSEARRDELLAELRAAGVAVAAADAPIGLVVNCTPLGLTPDDPLPLPAAAMPAGAAALDLVYARGGTAWVRALTAAGRAATDGREVLLEQGRASFACWFPGLDPPGEVMRAAIHLVLG